jgi:hypothetical protein
MEIFIKMFEEMGRIIGCDFEVVAEINPWLLVGGVAVLVLTLVGAWSVTRNN